MNWNSYDREDESTWPKNHQRDILIKYNSGVQNKTDYKVAYAFTVFNDEPYFHCFGYQFDEDPLQWCAID